jgi:membrane dipeptidase
MPRSAPVVDACQYCNWSPEILSELRQGGVDAICVTICYHEDFRETVEELVDWNRRFERHGDLIMKARSAADIAKAQAAGKTAVFFASQNPSCIEDDIGLVEVLKDLGLSVMQLTYNNQSLLGTGCYETEDTGITRMGREVIAEMNRVGMLIDMSHSAERTTREAIDISARPISITHSNPNSWHKSVRNKSDALLEALVARGGMLGLSLYPYHLKGGSDCTLASYCEMAVRVADMIGIDHVGIGSDLCQGYGNAIIEYMRVGRWTKAPPTTGLGAPMLPVQPSWFRDNRDWGKVRQGLLAHGLSETDAGKLLGGNWARFFADALEPR